METNERRQLVVKRNRPLAVLRPVSSGEAEGGENLPPSLHEFARRRDVTGKANRPATILNSLREMVFLVSRAHVCETANEAACRMLGRPDEDLKGRRMDEIWEPEVYREHIRPCLDLCLQGEEHLHQAWLQTPALGLRCLEISCYPQTDEREETAHAVLVLRDVTDMKETQEKLIRQAFYDPLTGLPNRALFLDRLGQLLRRRRRHPELRFAVLFLDLDDFKAVNDRHGHLAGDRLLIEIAGTLGGCLRPEDTAARFGGDEFAVLLDGIKDLGDAEVVAKRILQELSLPISIGGSEVFVRASIGVAMGGTADESWEEILQRADEAMYRAKRSGKGRFLVYGAASPDGRRTAGFELDWHRGLSKGEFRLFYQPVVQLASGGIIGFEALLRWQHPRRGLLAPAQFIPLAEQAGLMAPVGNWVIQESCRQLRAWRDRGPVPLTVSVNLSAKQFWHPDTAAFVQENLQRYGLAPSALLMEVAEETVVPYLQSAGRVMKRFQRLGVRVVLDRCRFNSDKAAVEQLPISAAKVACSPVASPAGARQEEMFSRLLSAAKANGVSPIAQGVETWEQLQQVRVAGCDLGQGNALYPPLAADEIARLPCLRACS